MKITRIGLFALCIFMMMSCLNTKTSPYQLSDDLDLILSQQWKSNQPGMTILVWEDGQVVSENYMGKTGKPDGSNLSSSTTFRMASLSKQFTAMAVLLLEKEGKLTLTQPLSDFFPDLPSWATAMTLQHLLTHTSGIVDYETLMPENWTHQIQDHEIVELLTSKQEVYFPAGAEFRYSNTAYCLLAVLVEKVAKQSYASFMQANLFEPLGMEDTFVYEINLPNSSRALGFRKSPDQRIIEADQSPTSATKGDGCIYTSIRDYQKWYEAIRDKRLVDIEAYLTKYGYRFPDNKQSGYGFGWFYEFPNETKGALELSHTGSTSGFSNVVVMVPEKDVLVLYFSNIADQHSLFNVLQNTIKPQLRYSWNLNWEKYHFLAH